MSMMGSYINKITGFFPGTFSEISTVTAIFHRIYLDFKQFSINISMAGL